MAENGPGRENNDENKQNLIRF